MAKRKIQSHAEWWEEHRERFEETDRLLLERMAFHRAKIAEERLRRERSVRARLARAFGRS
jgi:hypothetical protein